MEKDASRVVVERAAKAMADLHKAFRTQFGDPSSVRMNRADVEKMFEKMGPDDRLRFVQRVGMDEFMRMVGGEHA